MTKDTLALQDQKFTALLSDSLKRIEQIEQVSDFTERKTIFSHELDNLNLNILNLFKNQSNADLIKQLALFLPAFSPKIEAEKGFAIFRIAGIIVIGYLLGGILSALLGLVGLGGDILRPLTIFSLFYISEILVKNSKLRRCLQIFIGCVLGFGLLRGLIGKFYALENLALLRDNFLNLWRPKIPSLLNSLRTVMLVLVGGFLFLCEKSVIKQISFDLDSVKKEAQQRYNLLKILFSRIETLEARNLQFEQQLNNNGKCPLAKCSLVTALIPMLEFLQADQRAFLEQKIELLGYKFAKREAEATTLVWNEEKHANFYKKLGFIHNGDRCLILEPYILSPVDNQCLEKGIVEKID